jgi:hypothetical protein
MKAAARDTTLLAIAAALAAAGTFALRTRSEALRPPGRNLALDVPAIPAEVARIFTFGLRSFAADLTFLEAIQVHGARKLVQPPAEALRDDRALFRLLTYTSDLDEKFRGAYRFAGNALPRHDGNKVYGVFNAALLLQKGVRERPDDWQIPFQLGFLQSFYLGDMTNASKNIAMAAKVPGAPGYLGLLATRLAADAGNVETAQAMAETMAAQATEEQSQKEWQERLLDLAMERGLNTIDAAAARYKQREGKWPADVAALLHSGDLKALPDEPRGGKYYFDDTVGESRSTAAARLRVRGRAGTQAGMEVH